MSLVYYRLTQNFDGLPNGSCISEATFKNVYYLDKPLFEPISEVDIKEMIEYVDKGFCSRNGIERLFFYTEQELKLFLEYQERTNDQN